MVELVSTPTSFVSGDAALVNRSGSPAMVTLSAVASSGSYNDLDNKLPVKYDYISDLLASLESSRGNGAIWEAGGFRYEEVASGEHVTTAGGVKLKVLPGVNGYEAPAFGVPTDGTSNISATAQAAITALPNNSVLWFPPQYTYCLGAGGLNVASKTRFKLATVGGKIKLTAVASQTVAGFGATSIIFDGCTRSGIEGFEIDGNSIATNGICLDGCTDSFVQDVTIYSCGINGQILAAGGGVRNRFRRNTSHSASGTARGMWLGNVNATDMETDILIEGNTSRNNNASGIVVCSVGGRVVGNHSRTNEGAGIVLPGANGYAARGLAISANYCIDNLFHGIQADVTYTTEADLARDVSISGNVCSENNRGTGAGIYVVAAKGWSITGNTCNDNGQNGIFIGDRAYEISASGNVCRDTRAGGSRSQDNGIQIVAQAAAVSDVTVSGNTCDNNTTRGIGVTNVSPNTVAGYTLAGNVCTSNDVNGIFVAEAALGEITRGVVSGNMMRGNGTADLRLSARDIVIGPNSYSTQTDAQDYTFTDADTTPSVASRSIWRAANTGATTITAFDDGVDGQSISIRATNANTTIQHNSAIVNNGAANAALPGNGIISYIRRASVWYEISRSF